MPQTAEQLLQTHAQVQALVRDGRLDEAVGLCEQWVTVAPERALPFEWLVQCMVRRDGVPAATAAVEQNLARPDLPAPVRACLSGILAMYRLPVLSFGAWREGADASLALAEAGASAAEDVRWAPCALAIARAYQGRVDEARTLALRVLRRPGAPDAERGWMLAVLGMVEAGSGNGELARHYLEELRGLDSGNRMLPALEASMGPG